MRTASTGVLHFLPITWDVRHHSIVKVVSSLFQSRIRPVVHAFVLLGILIVTAGYMYPSIVNIDIDFLLQQSLIIPASLTLVPGVCLSRVE